MPLATGARLGPYEILAPLGQGDGRLIVLRRAGQDTVTSLNLIVNWFSEVRQRAGR